MEKRDMAFERPLRAIFYHLFNLHDGYSGVMAARKEFRRFLRKDANAVREHSFEKLERVIQHTFKTSPYYHDVWKKIGFTPDHLKSGEDIWKLPCLTKEVIEEHKERMVSGVWKKKDLDLSYTGGSSGTPTSFYRDKHCSAKRMGRQWGILELCGYRPGDRCGLIWGVHQDLPDQKGEQSFKRQLRKFASGKETLCCTIMNPELLSDFHQRLKSFRPQVLYGYPNAMTEFARFIKDQGLLPIKVRTIICTAERLTEEQRQLLQETFGGEVFNLYCTREHGCVGFECQKHKGFHIDTGSVHLEILKNGNIANLGETGDIVITDLLNYGMPFIRYRIGDRGSLSTVDCDCGINLPVLKRFDGRITDMLYRTDGSMVAGVMLVDMFMDEKSIKAIQIVQENLEEIDLFLVVSNEFSKEVEGRAVKQVRSYLGDEVKVNVKKVSEILRNPLSGKYQEVICKVKDIHGCHGRKN